MKGERQIPIEVDPPFLILLTPSLRDPLIFFELGSQKIIPYLNDAGGSKFQFFSSPIRKEERAFFSACIVPRVTVIQLIVGDGVVFLGFVDWIYQVTVFRVVFRIVSAHGFKWCNMAALRAVDIANNSGGTGAGFDCFDCLRIRAGNRRWYCGSASEDVKRGWVREAMDGQGKYECGQTGEDGDLHDALEVRGFKWVGNVDLEVNEGESAMKLVNEILDSNEK